MSFSTSDRVLLKLWHYAQTVVTVDSMWNVLGVGVAFATSKLCKPGVRLALSPSVK